MGKAGRMRQRSQEELPNTVVWSLTPEIRRLYRGRYTTTSSADACARSLPRPWD